MKKIKLALLGGDLRQIALADWMSAYGAEVFCYGLPQDRLPSGAHRCASVERAIEISDAVILPIPVSRNGIDLNCPLADKLPPTSLDEIFSLVGDRRLLGGSFSPSLKRDALKKGIKVIDYFELEELKIRNSVLAAEGALSIAMDNLNISIFGSKSAVIGYGRLAKSLVPMLRSLGSSVTVAARKSVDLAWAVSYGCNALKIGFGEHGISTLSSLADGYDVIFNTVPYWLFDEEVIKLLPSSTLIIDLASAPGGVDLKAAEKHNITVIPALSLPGKYAPVSAGRLLGEYLCGLLERS